MVGAELTGPFKVWKVIGARMSMADRGLTFGTNTEQGVCIRFHPPVRGIEPSGVLRHPGLTLTIADPPTVAHRLREISAASR